jgi:multiple sugar transport system ATP-binding protein
MASVTYEHVSKKFGDVIAVNDMEILVKDQEFLVLVGPSGCGKTTALRLLAGLEEVTEGKIYIGDRLVNDVPPKDRDIAMVFQSYALYPHMSVYDNMAFGLKLRKTPKTEIKRRVHEAAEILNITDLLDRKPRQLSGGQRVWPLDGPSSASLRSSSSTSRSRTWTPNSGCRRALRSASFTAAWRQRSSTSPTIRSRL